MIIKLKKKPKNKEGTYYTAELPYPPRIFFTICFKNYISVQISKDQKMQHTVLGEETRQLTDLPYTDYINIFPVILLHQRTIWHMLNGAESTHLLFWFWKDAYLFYLCKYPIYICFVFQICHLFFLWLSVVVSCIITSVWFFDYMFFVEGSILLQKLLNKPLSNHCCRYCMASSIQSKIQAWTPWSH